MADFDMKKREADIDKIVIKYVDGTEKEVDKGAVINLKGEGEEVNLNMEFAHMTGNDLATMIYGFLEMGDRMGLFNNVGESE